MDEKPKEGIAVYPKIIVFCPVEKKEIDGNKCILKCDRFKGYWPEGDRIWLWCKE